jgi:hypothetical protein
MDYSYPPKFIDILCTLKRDVVYRYIGAIYVVNALVGVGVVAEVETVVLVLVLLLDVIDVPCVTLMFVSPVQDVPMPPRLVKMYCEAIEEFDEKQH